MLPPIFGSIVKRISRNATDVVLKVRILLDPPRTSGEMADAIVLEAITARYAGSSPA